MSKMYSSWIGGWVALLCLGFVPATQGIETISKDPYIGAIVVNAATGEVIAEDGADIAGYPASMIKLMDLLIILEKVEQRIISLQDEVRVTAEAARMGGSQVYLAENEVFTVEELLYALMIQSANDAAVALAIHVAGSKDAFVELMNQKAKELGMTSTTFHSVHGLPPSKGQSPDITTCRDMALLCRALVQRPEVFAYTSETFRGFRDGKFEMRTHNKLLHSFDGCDGLKTGYFRAGGFSICATAERHGVRAIAVILGSRDKKVRNKKAAEWLNKGFLNIPRPAAQPVAAAN